MKTRIIHTKIWQDDWFYNLSSGAQRLFLYCITNEHIGLSGAYESSERVICFDLKLTAEEFNTLKAEIASKVIFTNGWVVIPTAYKYNPYSGAKNFVAYTKEFEQLPVEIKELLTGLSPADTLSSTKNTLSEIKNSTSNHNHKSVIINHKSAARVSSDEIRLNLREKGIRV